MVASELRRPRHAPCDLGLIHGAIVISTLLIDEANRYASRSGKLAGLAFRSCFENDAGQKLAVLAEFVPPETGWTVTHTA